MNEEIITNLFGDKDEEEMYRQALAVPLERKIEKAIALIQTFEAQALELSPEGYYVCDSFGKDSSVMMELFRMAGVKFKGHYRNTTIDPPELLYFGRKYHPDTVWDNPAEGNLVFRMKEESQGPPTRIVRWCCEIYKESGGNGLMKAIGVRAEESPRRKGLWKVYNNNNGGVIICPILYWTTKDIWGFIKKYDIPYCSLYDEIDAKGRKLFTRLGCVGCPMAGAKGQARDFKRWPRYERLWKKGFQAYWAKWKGVPTQKINKHGNHDR